MPVDLVLLRCPYWTAQLVSAALLVVLAVVEPAIAALLAVEAAAAVTPFVISAGLASLLDPALASVCSRHPPRHRTPTCRAQ